MKSLPKDLKVHVVSHTHWDREWRQPFEFFQPYLVKCLDQLLEIMERDPSYRAFLLDGQAVVAEDYLDARPEKTETIHRLHKKGRLFSGPWYSLIDNNLVDGESIVRNLLYGTRLAEQYGGCMREGYLISSFGHCGQIPQIFAGFGISSVIFSRGISEWQTRSELIWESPDGTQALGLHLPDRYTKSNWFYLVHRPGCVGREAMDWSYRWPADGPVHACDAASADHYWWRTQESFLKDPDNWHACVLRLIEKCLSVSTMPVLLALDGVDHLFPHADVPEIIRAANERLGREVLVHSTLPDYVKDVRAWLKKHKVALEVKKDEMRRPMKVPGFNQLLAGTVSARMPMKLQNAAAESALIRGAEPLCALASLFGAEYPRPFLNKAWKLLMVNHAHDGICGTSVDAVHDAMTDRYRRARDIAEFAAYEAEKEIAVRMDTSRLGGQQLALTVFNATGFRRSRVVRAVVDIPWTWKPEGVRILDTKGRPVPFRLKTKQRQEREILADHEAQLGFLCLRVEVEFLAEDLPAWGWKTWIAEPGPWLNEPRPAAAGPFEPAIVRGPAMIENEHLRAWIEPDGSLSLLNKATEVVHTDLNVFVSSGDIGDSTTFVPPMEDFSVFSQGFETSVQVVERGPLSAGLRVVKRMRVPARCEPRAKFVELVETAQPFKARRSDETVELVIISTITLEAGARRVDIRTEVDNTARDHRLRVLFPSGAEDARAWVGDAPFDAVERDIALPDTTDWAELWPETQPIRAFFAVSDAESGLAVFVKGIPEAACLDDEARTLALTLLRCTRRSIGENYALEGPQCPGKHVFEYAVQPFSGAWQDKGLPRAAQEFLSPVRAVLSASGRKGLLPLDKEALSWETTPASEAGNVVLSGLKLAEDSNDVIVRLYNAGPGEARIRFASSGEWQAPCPVRLDETPDEGLKIKNNGQLPVGPHKIVSFRLKRK